MSALPLPAAPASFPVPSLALPGDLTLPAGRTAVMGILNVTPDSFSDGGRYADVAAALRHAREMVAAGADLIDVGGDSTRPNSTRISAEQEWARLGCRRRRRVRGHAARGDGPRGRARRCGDH